MTKLSLTDTVPIQILTSQLCCSLNWAICIVIYAVTCQCSKFPYFKRMTYYQIFFSRAFGMNLELMCTASRLQIPNHVAIKIALELKKLLVDNSLLDVYDIKICIFFSLNFTLLGP